MSLANDTGTEKSEEIVDFDPEESEEKEEKEY
jgi:hypothetical protein